MAELRAEILAVLAEAPPIPPLSLYQIRTAADARFPRPSRRFLFWSWRPERTPSEVLNELDRLVADGLVRSVRDPSPDVHPGRRLYWLANRG